MYNSKLENKLIIIDIADALQDYTSIQVDIDETKIKAAQLLAITLDLKRLIGSVNINRCSDPQTEADENLKELLTTPLCYFTYGRLLKHFQGTFTESGFMIEDEAEDRNVAKSTANDYIAIGETFMDDVFEFLKKEDPNDENVDENKVTPRIRVFGGEENRASN